MEELVLQPQLLREYISYIDRGEQTTRTYLADLRQFAAWAAYAGVTRPQRQDLIAYREYLLSEHEAIQYDPARGWSYRKDSTGRPYKITCRPGTAAQYLRSVCQFFRWTAAAGLYPNVAENLHAPKIRRTEHRKEALLPEEVQAVEAGILEQIQQAGNPQKREQALRLHAMFLLAVTAGLRVIELARANIRDLHERNGHAVLYIWGKGHTEPDTRKPIAREVYAAILRYLEARSGDKTGSRPLFVATGSRSGGERLASTTISTMLKRALQRAGIDSERITAHSLRHTTGTAAQALCGDLYLTQQYMRHSNPATTEIYLHTNTEQQQDDLAQAIYALYHKADNQITKRR